MQYAWTAGDNGALLIEAADDDEAYRVSIAHRLSTGQTLEEAVSWAVKHDRIVPIIGSISDSPFVGELPE